LNGLFKCLARFLPFAVLEVVFRFLPFLLTPGRQIFLEPGPDFRFGLGSLEEV
jgi:hypothetical protein